VSIFFQTLSSKEESMFSKIMVAPFLLPLALVAADVVVSVSGVASDQGEIG